MNIAYLQLLPTACLQTLYMVFSSAFFASLVGIPLGAALFFLRHKAKSYAVLSFTINIGRSLPFAILMIALIPFTKWIVGTSLGTTAAIVPLSCAAIPYFARAAESCFTQVSPTILDAVILMGASPKDLLTKVLLPEALPSLLTAFTTLCIHLVGYSAMAGLIGGGGLGQIALQYGYQRFNTPVLLAATLCLVLLVQGIQKIGHSLSHRLSHKKGKSHAS